MSRFGLSARAYHRILKVARTIADLASAETVGSAHVAEAIALRRFDAAMPEDSRVEGASR
jgi:magnesium chelatase family protein